MPRGRCDSEVISSMEEAGWENGIEGFMATSDLQRVAEYIDQYLPEIYYVNSEPGCVDIMASGVSKWRGIKIPAESLNIAHEDILTVGNYYNDIDIASTCRGGNSSGKFPPGGKRCSRFCNRI